MRLDRVYIDGFKNLKDVEVDFDESKLTTVLIGENGSGKSNLMEAIVDIFRFADTDNRSPRYRYEVDYRIDGSLIRLSNLAGQPGVSVDGRAITKAAFARDKSHFFPDLVFGYYSGGSRRLEKLFDDHQSAYYRKIQRNEDPVSCREAHAERRLFYCRPIHGAFALLSSFAFPDPSVMALLARQLRITGFHSALAHFKEPWYAAGGEKKKLKTALEFWGAKGPAGACARSIREQAFYPMALRGNAVDDYRAKKEGEAQFACFLRDEKTLLKLSADYRSDQEMFVSLEAADISDLFRELHIWVNRQDDRTGDVSFGSLSDGERQLLMVLGLMRASRGKRSIFLLDEPDTHLNPLWQLSYLDLIREWVGIVSEEDKCQVIMTSHNPLTIAALDKGEVRVMSTAKDGVVFAQPPFVDPRGLGFAGVLTDIFGMPSTLDKPTQDLVDDRNRIARLESPSVYELTRLEEINHQLRSLGFMYEERDPLYSQFLRKLDDVEMADAPPLTPDEMQARDEATTEIVEELLKEQ